MRLLGATLRFNVPGAKNEIDAVKNEVEGNVRGQPLISSWLTWERIPLLGQTLIFSYLTRTIWVLNHRLNLIGPEKNNVRGQPLEAVSGQASGYHQFLGKADADRSEE